MQNFRLSTVHVKFHQICTLIGSLKYKILAKKYRGVISHDLKIDAKFEEKLIYCFKNDKNLVKFDLSTQKSPKLQLLFAPIVQSI